LELAGVKDADCKDGNERQLASLRLAGDQYVIRTDGRSLRREVRSDLPGLPSVLVVELQHRKLKRVHTGHVLLHPLTLERAVVQLVDDDCRHTENRGARGDERVGRSATLCRSAGQ
jgi:hypothetical protein